VAWVIYRSLYDLEIPFKRTESRKSAYLPSSYQVAIADMVFLVFCKLSKDTSAAIADSLVVLDF
jgi:hypothetical protein